MNTIASKNDGITFIDDLPFKPPVLCHLPPHGGTRDELPPVPAGHIEAIAYDLTKNDGSYWMYRDGFWSIQSVTLTPHKPLRGQSRVFAAIDDGPQWNSMQSGGDRHEIL